jgi:DNA-directed RNA polymerase specialized sigma24 family protein
MPSAEEQAMSRLDWDIALEVLQDLPPRQQQALALSLDGYTSAEIADQLGIEASAARASLHFARKKLAAAITGHGQPKKAAARAGQENAPEPAPDIPGPKQDAITQLERTTVIAALRNLPDRQRQALVLRYYADLSEARIAEMMGIKPSAVKSHMARGMSSLRCALEQATDSKVLNEPDQGKGKTATPE